MSSIVVSSTAELKIALGNATGGETIYLAPGEYETFFKKDLTFDPDVTITSLDPDNPATFSEPMTFVRADGLVLDNIAFISKGIEDREPQLFLHSCKNVTMINLEFVGYIPTEAEGVDPLDPATGRRDVIAGYGYERGLRIHNSENVSLEDASFRDLRLTVYVGESSDISLARMNIENVREGVLFYETQRMSITDSTFQNFKPWLGMDNGSYDTNIHDHPDMIQYWGDNSRVGVHDITISGNTFSATPGQATQTIFGHLDTARSDEVTASNFTVTNNMIINGQTHGISLGDVDGAVIADNVLLPLRQTETPGQIPSIRLPGSRNVLVENNTVVAGYGVVNASQSELTSTNVTLHANTLLSNDEGDASYWKLWTPPSVYALAQEVEEGGATSIRGTEQDDTIWAHADGSFLYGLDGNDKLNGRQSSDIMTGGGGADRFLYDMRSRKNLADDMILDLNFEEGDEIYVLTSQEGLFRDTINPDNSLRVLSEGKAVLIDSIADLWELVATGTMTYESDGHGGGVIRLANGTGYALHLAGIDSLELGYAAAFDSTVAVTGTAAADVIEYTPDAISAPSLGPLQGAFLNGLDGDDTLSGREGGDIMTGGRGADQFLYDLRDADGQQDDLILDLDFAQGDEILIQTGQAGLFSDGFDPDNTLETRDNGASAVIDSHADLWEILISGAWNFTQDSKGSGLLSLADGSGYSLYLRGHTPQDIPNFSAVAGLTFVTGSDARETLRGASNGAFINGLGGNDVLAGRSGTDIMMGGAGADRFHFDLRSSSPQEDDTILDLDFSEGDEIFVLTSVDGLFDNSVDPDNALRIMGQGRQAMIDSFEDLAEITASGAMVLTSDGAGGSYLRVADGTGYVLHLLNIDAGDLF